MSRKPHTNKTSNRNPIPKSEYELLKQLLDELLNQNNLLIERREFYYLYKIYATRVWDTEERKFKDTIGKELLLKRYSILVIYEYAISLLVTKKVIFSRKLSLLPETKEIILDKELLYSNNKEIDL